MAHKLHLLLWPILAFGLLLALAAVVFFATADVLVWREVRRRVKRLDLDRACRNGEANNGR